MNQAGADVTPVVAALVPNSPPKEAVSSAASPVKEVTNVEKQIGNAGPSAEKAVDSKAKAEPKPQVSSA